MLPFGSQPWGQGWIGRGDWGRRVFWENVPAEQQDADAAQGDPIQQLLKAWGDEYDALLQTVLELPQQRDCFQARDVEVAEVMYVTQTWAETEEGYGPVIKFVEPADAGDFPTGSVPITQVGPTWNAWVGNGRWPVVLVRTRSADATYVAGESIGNEVWCSTGDVLPFAYTDEAIGTGDGTASPTVGTALPVRFAANPGVLTADAGVAVTFYSALGAAWVTAYDNGAGELREDVAGSATGNLRGTVDYDAGTIVLDVAHDVPGDTVTAATAITATYTVVGYYVTFRPTSMLAHLTADFGMEADSGVTSDARRAALVYYPEYMGQKGTAHAYAVLGSIYLFDVAATGLWDVCDDDVWAGLPSGHAWTYVDPSSGIVHHLTDLQPTRLRFDDIAADAEFYDAYGDHSGGVPGLVPLLDRELFWDDGTVPPAGDGWSAAKGFAVDVTQGYWYPARVPATVVSVTALTSAEAAAYGLPYAQRVVVAMSQDQKDEFNWTGRGLFALTEYDQSAGTWPTWTTTPHWVDAEDETTHSHGWDPIGLTWTVIVGASAGPTVGSDIAVRYSGGIDVADCCFCRSNYVRVVVDVTAAGEAHYGADMTAADAPYKLARDRLIARIERLMVPTHVRPIFVDGSGAPIV